jgi:FlaA1/EpsC-like NDP-sugar epimerase
MRNCSADKQRHSDREITHGAISFGSTKIRQHEDEGRSMEKRVLATGGAGFLSSHLCARLLDQECELLYVDDF